MSEPLRDFTAEAEQWASYKPEALKPLVPTVTELMRDQSRDSRRIFGLTLTVTAIGTLALLGLNYLRGIDPSDRYSDIKPQPTPVPVMSPQVTTIFDQVDQLFQPSDDIK